MSQFYSYPPVPAGSLPAGAATAANQVTEIASLASIDGKLTAPLAVTAAALPLPSGASTAALQTQPGVDIGDVTVNNAVGAAAVNIQDGGNSITVDGTFFQATQPVSIASSVPVTGPLTDTELRATAVPISGTVTADAGSGTFAISAAALPLPSGAATSALQTQPGVDIGDVTVNNGAAGAAVNIQDGGNSITVDGTFFQATQPVSIAASVAVTGPLTDAELRASAVPISAAALPLPSGAATSALQSTINTTLGSPFQAGGSIGNTSFIATQATGTDLHMVVDSGTITAVTAITNALPVGANVIGKVSIDQTTPGTTNLVALAANQSVNVAQINGVTTLMGNGGTGTGSQRVTIASDNTAFTVNAAQSGTWTVQPGNTANTTAWLISQAGKAIANASAYNDYSSVNVLTSAYVQLIASTTSATTEVEIFDSSGQGMILAVGAAASEVDQIYIFPGGNGRVPLKINASSRVSIKAKTATASVGFIMINLYA